MSIIFDPLLPQWALIAIAAGGAIFAFLSLLRNWKSGLPRALAIAFIILFIANPLRREAETTPLNDIALILVDESGSQSLDGRDAAAEEAVRELQTRLGNIDGVETVTAPYSGADETRTVAALSQALADIPRRRLSGVFIVTDGQSTDAEDAATFPSIDAPIHILTTGAENETDRKINLINAPRYGIVRQSVRVSFRVDDLGPEEVLLSDQQTAEVTLRIDGEEVISEPVPIGTEAGFDVPLNRPGQLTIELEAEARRGELTTRNNIAVLPITAVRDRLRVLLISGEPHPGERVWRNLLKSDAAVDLVHFTILRPIDKNDGTPVDELALIPFPQDELFIDKLEEFDLLIFDRYAYRGVLSSFHFDNIARFVDSGGAVLIASGPEYNGPLSLAGRRNLSFILPALPSGAAVEEAYRPEVAALGERHPVTADLPDQDIWGRWLRLMPVAQNRGQTLMTGPDGAPLLILDRIGEGRVGLFLSDHVWLWARGFDGGGPHAELLRRIAHWLMKEPELEEEALSLRAEGRTLVIERRTIEDTAPPVTLTLPDGSVREVEVSETSPGEFVARIEDAPRGNYRAASGELFAVGAVGLDTVPEFENVISTGAKLAPLATRSRGGIFSIRRGSGANPPAVRRLRENASEYAGADWAGLITRNDERVDSIKDASFAPAFVWLIPILALLIAAWAIEGGGWRRKIAEN